MTFGGKFRLCAGELCEPAWTRDCTMTNLPWSATDRDMHWLPVRGHASHPHTSNLPLLLQQGVSE